MDDPLDKDIEQAIVELKARIPDPVDVTIAGMADLVLQGKQTPARLVKYMLYKRRSKLDVIRKLRAMTTTVTSA